MWKTPPRFSLSVSGASRRVYGGWFLPPWRVIGLHALLKGRFCCFPKDPLEDVETWAESVDKLLGCKGESPSLALAAARPHGLG